MRSMQDLYIFIHPIKILSLQFTMSIYGGHQLSEVEMVRHLPHVHTLSAAVHTHIPLKILQTELSQV